MNRIIIELNTIDVNVDDWIDIINLKRFMALTIFDIYITKNEINF